MNELVMNIPTLRFAEFEGEWELKKLGEVVKINQGLQIAISERYLEYVENSYFYITNEFLREKSDKKYFIKNPPKSVLCNKDDILMTRTGNTGMVVTNVEGAFHNNFFKIAYPDYINKDFLYYFLNLQETQNLILKMAGTSTIPDLNHSDFYRIQITFPTLPEQKKIAGFLSAVDEKLQQLKQKKALLEQYKKGVMQQIFNQELRFKDDDGNEYPEWEEKSLGEVYTFNSTNSYSRENLNYEYGLVKNIHYGDIHTKFKTLFDITKEQVPFLNDNINIEKINPNQYLTEGDLVIADASEDYADIGKSIEIININAEKLVAGLHTLHARPNTNTMKIGFGGYLLQTESTRLQIKKIAQGTKVLSISTGRLAEILITIPSIAEQTKIANFLSAIDEKITNITNQITLTEQWKKGLLQKMFV